MKALLIFASCMLLAAASPAPTLVTPDYFTTANDFLDMQAVVDDPDKLKTMIYCFIDKGPCDVVSQSYKDLAYEGVSQSCRRCNDAQKHMSNVFFTALEKRRPEDYEKFFDKYDPQRLYKDSFLKSFKGY